MKDLQEYLTSNFKKRIIEESFLETASRVKNDLIRNWKPYAKGAAIGGIGAMLGNHLIGDEPVTTNNHESTRPEESYINKNPQFKLPEFTSEGNNVTPISAVTPVLDLGDQASMSQSNSNYFTKLARGNIAQEIYNNLARPVNNITNQAPVTPVAPIAPIAPIDNSSPISPIIYDSRKGPEFSLPNFSHESDNITRAPTTKPDLNLGSNVSTPTTHTQVRQYNAPIMIDIGETPEFSLPNSSHESNNITRAPTTKPGFEDQASSKPQKDPSNNFTKRHILDKYSDPHSPYYHRIHA